jgi:antitoxin ParD1/3/4
MPTANVSLSAQHASFIRQAIDDGRFQNASEVVRAGLHLLKQQAEHDDVKLAHLRRLAREGFDDVDRGDYELLTKDSLKDFLDSVRAAKPASGRRRRRA